MRTVLPLLLLLASPCVAQDGALPMECAGVNPDWTLDIGHDSSPDTTTPATTAIFDYPDEIDLDFALETRANGADWPLAYTFVGRGTSLILLVEQPSEDNILPARVFTQNGSLPVLLVGECRLING